MFKYFGVLKGFDFDNINRNTFQLLIDSNIFNISELSNCYKNKDDYFGLELDNLNWRFSNFYLFNQKEYHLKNEVLMDMFHRCKLKIESLDELDENIYELEFNLNIQVSDFAKIHFLKKFILELNHRISNKKYYLLYANNFKTNGFTSWYNFFFSEQIDNENYEYIYRYLKGEQDYIPIFIKDIWKEYFIVNKLTIFCEKKIHILEKQSGINEADIKVENISKLYKFKSISESNEFEYTKTKEAERSDIFNDDGEQIFKFILSKYPQKQTKAFFSYLYFYLRNINKIIPLGDDSLEYREYIINNSPIKSFSKIQKTVSEKTNTKKNKIFILFDKYLSEFNDRRKIEENLN